jgi:hypothetical protein
VTPARAAALLALVEANKALKKAADAFEKLKCRESTLLMLEMSADVDDLAESICRKTREIDAVYS